MRRGARRRPVHTAIVKRAAPYACRLVIMAKVPEAGRVKSRLAREIGVVQATRFYRHAARNQIARLGAQPFWRAVLVVTPDAGVGTRMLPSGVARAAQGGGDLGARMQRPMRILPPGPVCVVGTDLPDIRVADVRRAFRALGQADVVFGPAQDGGFWLVGMRRGRRIAEPYGGVAWSRPTTLEETLANLEGVPVAFTTRRSDVDEARDLAANGGRYARRVRAPWS